MKFILFCVGLTAFLVFWFEVHMALARASRLDDRQRFPDKDQTKP